MVNGVDEPYDEHGPCGGQNDPNCWVCYPAAATRESFMQAWDMMLREDPERLGRLVQLELDVMEKQLTSLPTWLELSLAQQEERQNDA